MAAIEEQAGSVTLRLRVQPKASRDAVTLSPEGQMRVALTAPPVDGEANGALVVFLARRLGVAKSAVHLLHGQKSREKTLRITGVTVAQVRAALLGDGM